MIDDDANHANKHDDNGNETNYDNDTVPLTRRRAPVDPIIEARRNWRLRGWGEECAAGMAVMTSIVRVEQLLRSRLERSLVGFGLTMAQYELLVLLSFTRTGSMSLSRLGQRLQVRPASVTPVVNKLVEASLVRRHRNPDDGRSALATITLEGRRVASAAVIHLNTEVYPTLGLGASQLDDLLWLLARIRSASGDFVEDQDSYTQSRAISQ